MILPILEFFLKTRALMKRIGRFSVNCCGNSRQTNRVNEAVSLGAELLHGNNREGAVYPPTVVDKVPYDWVVGQFEIPSLFL